MKRILSIILIVFLLSGILCGCGGSEGDAKTPVEGKKVVYIMHMAESEIFTLWSDAAKETAEELGMKYEAVFCNGSDEEWKKQIENYASKGFDGLLLSHGGQDYAYTFLKGIQEQYPDLKIVTFDTQFIDESGKKQTLDGVTQFFQQDARLTELLLEYITGTLYADKAGPVNILKVWKGPGYLAPFDRREVGYVKYEESGFINTLQTIAPTDLSDAEESIYQIALDTLAQYEEGEIDAIWCCYDLYAGGVYRALKEGGYTIPLVSVDINYEDIAAMQEENSPWKACATSDWSYNGEFGIRVLALEIAGEYDKIIDPLTGEASNWLEVPVYLVKQETVTEDGEAFSVADVEKLAEALEAKAEWMVTTDWMEN